MSDKITGETLIKLSLNGEKDLVTCRVCGVERIIEFELIGAGRSGLSLVPDKKEKQQRVKDFHLKHAVSCLGMTETEANKIFRSGRKTK